ncbi:MAG: UvrD-helicase domain-containing protein [Candidatus Babeliaceae bacterium]
MHSSFSHFLENNLNELQQQIVVPEKGILLIRAGAGSGKTRIITARIAHLLLHHHIPSHAILALTFTNKAANEMKERVTAFLAEESLPLPFVGTFHAYCLRFLKMHGHLINVAQFTILDDDDQQKLLRTLIARAGTHKRVSAQNVAHTISLLKNEAVMGTITINQINDAFLRDLVQLYEHEKTVAHCLDFDDLLLYTIRILRAHTALRKNVQQVLRHILVDEYQDTNQVQHALLKLLTLDDNNNCAVDSICIVGDEDQSIYSWRGATVSNMVNFAHEFPDTQPFVIEQNYRSVQPILHTANKLIEHNTFRNPKKLWSAQAAHDRIRVLNCASQLQEADAIALCIVQKKNRTSLKNIALLYRSHYQSRALEEALIRHQIAYKIFGGIQFYERQEIKDLLAYLRLIVNPFDRISFMRIINVPARGLGDKFLELFFTLWDTQPFSTFIQIAELLSEKNELTASKKEALLHFLHFFEDITAHDKASVLINNFIQQTYYFSYLKESFETEEATAKIENVKELITVLKAREEEQAGVAQFLDEVALLQEQLIQAHTAQDYVHLMTLHAAKGLEFDMVIIAGLEENILPSGHAAYQTERLEEERRLLYVGITRARQWLLMTYARYRPIYGSLSDQKPSRFLTDIPLDTVQFDDISLYKSYQLTSYFSAWFTTKPVVKNPVSYDQPPFDEEDAPPASSNFIPAQTTKQFVWEKGQQVKHATFGKGIIEQVEQKQDDTYLTIKFGSKSKKIAAHFIEQL